MLMLGLVQIILYTRFRLNMPSFPVVFPWFNFFFVTTSGCFFLFMPHAVYYEFRDSSIDYTFINHVWSVPYTSITSLVRLHWWQSFGNLRINYDDSQKKSLCVAKRKSFIREFAAHVPAAKIETA